jgi:hypothetical protein
MTLSIITLCHYAEFRDAEYRILFIVMLSVLTLNVIKLYVVMVNVIMMNAIMLHDINYFSTFLSLSSSGGIQTLDLRIRSQVFCHCATGAQPASCQNFEGVPLAS